jgi:hypothetical protein
MARRIDKLQINALNASNNNILVARGGELAFDDPANIFVGSATDAGFANVSLEANLANVALEANVANTVLSISNFTTDDLNEGSANLYFTDSRAITAVDPKLTTANVTELTNLYFTNARVTASVESTVFSNVQAVTITANSFASSGFGVPTIESATNIVLSANGTNGGAVVIQDSALRLRSYDDGAIANLTASAGDAIFNSSIGKAQIYDGANWANVGAGIADGDQDYSGNLLPTASNTYSLGSSDLRWKDLYLSGNTIFLGDIQLSSANSKLVVDAIEATTITTSNPTLYSAGRGITISQTGIIATSADDSELYDVGIDQSSGYKLTDSMEVALNYPNTSPYPALIYSFLLTNASPDSPGFANVKGVYRDPTGNAIYFADGLQISFANTIELAEKPGVILPGTTISLQADANDLVYATFVYKTLDDLSYTQRSTNISTSGELTEAFQTDNAAVIESIKVFNKLDAAVPVTVAWIDENDSIKSYFVSNVSVAPKGFKQILTTPKLMGLGDKVKIANFGGQSDAVTAMVSARFGEVYNITPSSNVLNEGDEITFAITTINVPSFSTRYFRTLGNVVSADFVEGNTGSFVIIDNAANITLTVSADQSEISEGEETFQLQVMRQSVAGPLLRTSPDVVLIKDTSNLINFSSSSTPASIYETEEAIITINTINAVGSPGGTVYYTITGNADIYSNTSGAIEINNNTANLSLIADASVPDNEQRQFTVQIRRDSISGTIIGTTSNIIVNPIPPGPLSISATGGTITEIEI